MFAASFVLLFLFWGVAASRLTAQEAKGLKAKAGCQFHVQFETHQGREEVQDEWCYKATKEGLKLDVTGDVDHVVIWDDTPGACPTPNHVFVHFAGKEEGAIRVTGAGARTVHDLHAAYYNELPTSTLGCQHFTQAAEAYRKDAVAGFGTGRLDFKVAHFDAKYPFPNCVHYGRTMGYAGPQIANADVVAAAAAAGYPHDHSGTHDAGHAAAATGPAAAL